MTTDLGCTDSGCPFRDPGGMRTNRGCRCLLDTPPELRVALRKWASEQRSAFERGRRAGMREAIEVAKEKAWRTTEYTSETGIDWSDVDAEIARRCKE